MTFEYVLLGGFNDAPEDARRVVKSAGEFAREGEFDSVESGRRCRISKPDAGARAKNFDASSTRKACPRFVRYSRGQDVMAACGQLALLESATPLQLRLSNRSSSAQ